MHKTVLLNEVIRYLNPKKGDVVLDGTLGGGGHAVEILNRVSPSGLVIGIDQDEEALKFSEERLKNTGLSSYKLVKDNFKNIDLVLRKIGVDKINGAVFDLGVSSLHLDEASRGFSMANDGPLDMRMDRGAYLTAYEVVNKYSEKDLFNIIKTFGEERYASRITNRIAETRKKKKIETTSELAELIKTTIGHKYMKYKIHPATRTFQAIRMEVNNELGVINELCPKLLAVLKNGAKMCFISFHSLEDRIIKNFFRDNAREGKVKILTKKPITASVEEVLSNPRSRSAKLRAAEYIG